LHILDLPETATGENIRTAYRELVKVWHPDRFAHDPKLQHRAQEKLKQINFAYEWLLQNPQANVRHETPTEPQKPPNQTTQTRQQDSTDYPTANTESKGGYGCGSLIIPAIVIGFAAGLNGYVIGWVVFGVMLLFAFSLLIRRN
jgi:hypothetical protein